MNDLSLETMIKIVADFVKVDFVIRFEMSHRTYSYIKAHSIIEYSDNTQISPYSIEVFIRNDLPFKTIKKIYKSSKKETIELE